MSDYNHCPKCGHTAINVDITGVTTLHFRPGDHDGQMSDGVDCVRWSEESDAVCQNCGYIGVFADFQHTEPFLPSRLQKLSLSSVGAARLGLSIIGALKLKHLPGKPNNFETVRGLKGPIGIGRFVLEIVQQHIDTYES